MASFLGSLRSTTCASCMKRISRGIESSPNPFVQQIRGKKKLAQQSSSLKVRLLQDVPKYGRRGAIIPVAAGRMRNQWYPNGMAEYVSTIQIRELGLEGAKFERDATFRPDQPEKKTEIWEKKEKKAKKHEQIGVDVPLLSPQRVTEILTTVVPERIEFYRTPIAVPREEKATPKSRSRAVNSAAADLAAASEPAPGQEVVGIHGSVSTADIASSIKALLGGNQETARVVLSAEDIHFVGRRRQQGEGETDRVKELGDFEVEIRLKGAPGVVRRTVSIQPVQVQ
ncbi:hypothetical protein L228DRAFT_248915 [Xylona heveae TC161]|uniref:Ribosomal protein L9 domain-containing protein n=1 Tax=Xylona heveae (strain CBS 132557 / TC161) TaxID=1328760 RepID=A0A165FM55_XYLHT|nr:hypothetical protein L228DRAFT_248915 [Xylona heveae TC161]KZF21143.1 hypothetical protein L228DRAFT_248915 [Xylona heveae TC161]